MNSAIFTTTQSIVDNEIGINIEKLGLVSDELAKLAVLPSLITLALIMESTGAISYTISGNDYDEFEIKLDLTAMVNEEAAIEVIESQYLFCDVRIAVPFEEFVNQNLSNQDILQHNELTKACDYLTTFAGKRAGTLEDLKSIIRHIGVHSVQFTMTELGLSSTQNSNQQQEA